MCISAVHIIIKMNSINWPAPNVWVFIAQLVEHCSTNVEAVGQNPVKVPKFFGVTVFARIIARVDYFFVGTRRGQFFEVGNYFKYSSLEVEP